MLLDFQYLLHITKKHINKQKLGINFILFRLDFELCVHSHTRHTYI